MNSFFFDTGLILALTELAKRAFGVKPRFLPLLAVAFGIGLAFVNGVSKDNFILGLVAALTASGLYSGAKAGLGR